MASKNFDALIFDLDGTLWDSSAPVTRAWDKVAKRVPGHPGITSQDIASIMGMPHREIFVRLFPGLSDAEREVIANQCYREEQKALNSEGGALYEGVTEGLRALRSHFPLYLVSNCQTDYLVHFLQASGVGELFSDSECHGNTRKPKADNIRALAERNGLVSAAYIGDTASDQMAAERAGTMYFHVDYGFGEPSRDCLRFPSFAKLTEFFLSSV